MSEPIEVRRGTPRWAVSAAAASIAVFASWVFLGIGGDWATQVFDNLSVTAAPLLAAVACALSARRAVERLRVGWLLLGAGCLSWGIGQAIWTYYELVLRRDVPFPSLADISYLGFIPCVAAGLLLFPTSPRGVALRLRAFLDGLIVAGSLLFLSWALILKDVIGAGSTLLEEVIGLAYPLGDVVLVAMMVLVATRARSGRVPLAMVGAGLLFIAVADTGFLYSSLQDTYSTGKLMDAGWLSGFIFVALAAIQRQQPLETKETPIRAQRARILLPYLPVGAGLVIASVRIARGDSLDAFLLWTAIVVWVAVIVRQFATLFENVELARSLAQKVSLRTKEVRFRDEQIRSILDTANDAYVAMDDAGIITAWNPMAEKLFGWPSSEAIGRPLSETVIPYRYRSSHQEGLRRFLTAGSSRIVGNGAIEMVALQRDGREFPVEMTIWSRREGEHLSFNAFIRDITERKRFEEELAHQALHDQLTGLANRTLFGDRLTHALSAQMRSTTAVGLIFLDIDDFKTVNDSLGHTAGDELLIGVAGRLRELVRPHDTVARLGGDEFAILIEAVAGEEEVAEVAHRAVARLQEPFHIEGRRVPAQASFGIVVGHQGDDGSVLMRNADVAMYRAKSAGKGRYEVFAEEMHEAALGRLELQSDLPQALENGELFLGFQPIVELATNRIKGFEALVRWRHPTRGLVLPGEFIPVAEESGFIVQLGRWVVETACRTARDWSMTYGPVTMSVNVSSRQVEPDFASAVAEALAATGLPAEQLILEFTEGLVMRDTEATIETMRLLSDLGVLLAVDDFGTGYSSLGYLEQFPIDILKIDKSFVRGTLTGEESALARAIVKIAGTLGLDVIAEGVERAEQAASLRRFGCKFGQGFFFSPPVDAISAEELLRSNQAGPTRASGDLVIAAMPLAAAEAR